MHVVEEGRCVWGGKWAYNIKSKAADRTELIMAYDAVCQDPQVVYCDIDLDVLELVIIKELLVSE